MAKNKKYIIWGSSGHAKVVASLVREQGGEVHALFDNNSKAKSALKGIKLYIGEKGFKDWLKTIKKPSDYTAIIAIGGSAGNARIKIFNIFKKAGVGLESITHKTSVVCKTAKIGKGTQLLAQTLVSSDAKIGDACILNHKASVDHECILGNGVHLAPSTTLCGCVELGDNVFVAAGATILPRIKVGKNSIIGAGSVVTKNIPAGVVAYGSPAKVVRKNKDI